MGYGLTIAGGIGLGPGAAVGLYVLYGTSVGVAALGVGIGCTE